jgi:hypothetical protein
MCRLSYILSIALLVGTISLQAQAPPGINYQGVARNMEGKPLTSQRVTIRVSVLQNSESGDTEFMETHDVTTNPFGLFTLVIGKGNAVTGNFGFISWALGNKWLRIELDPDGGNAFQLMGSQQLMSVPYAFYAQYSGNGYTAGPGININNSIISNTGDADSNPANELITSVSFGADKKLRITDAGGTKEADLNSLVGAGQNLEQVLTMGNTAGGRKISNLATPTAATDAATKAYVDAHADGDANATNEIQDLSLTGNILAITKNSTASQINLTPYLDNTDSQTLALSGSNLSIANGNSINLASLNTDAQTISLVGNNLSISGGNSVDISGINTDTQNLSLTTSGTQRTVGISGGTGVTLDVADNDNNPTNEIQDLALSGNTLSITNNASATNINLAPYLDNTDNQDLTLTSNTLSLTNDGTSVNLAAYLDNTDSQTLATQSVDANTRSVSISGGNVVNVDVRDADASVTNEIQDLSISGNTLSLSGDATSVNLAGYLDNTDAQTLSYNGTTKALSVSGGNSVTITETQTLSQVLTQGADASNTRITGLATPTGANDATTKQYVDNADAALSARISTTYAFKTNFSFLNSSGLLANNQTLPFATEDFDDFNVLASNTFTATENGVYVFIIDGSHVSALPSGQLSFLFNGTKYQVPIVQTSLGFRFNATQMFNLTAGQTVTLVGDSILVGASFTGTFFGYKL